MNGYIAIYKGKQKEIYANSSFDAQQKALSEFQKTSRRKIKSWEISVTICEVEEKQITHSPNF